MSVMMGLRISVDTERFKKAINSDPERLRRISERSKEHGAIHHRFFANVAGGEVLVVDEWPGLSPSSSSSPAAPTSGR